MSAADGRAPSAWAVREPADREPDLSDPGSHREHRRDLALIAPRLPGPPASRSSPLRTNSFPSRGKNRRRLDANSVTETPSPARKGWQTTFGGPA